MYATINHTYQSCNTFFSKEFLQRRCFSPAGRGLQGPGERPPRSAGRGDGGPASATVAYCKWCSDNILVHL